MSKFLANLFWTGVIALIGLLILGAISSTHDAVAQTATAPQVHTNITHQTNLRDGSTSTVLSKPRLSPAFINQVLASYGSPTQGKGQLLYDLGQKYQISSDLALAFYGHESTFGTAGEARFSKSLGNMRCLGSGYEDLATWCQDGFAWFDSWDHGFEAFYRLLRTLYVNGWKVETLAQLIQHYAPSSDGNDEKGYVRELTSFLTAWYEGRVRP
ncbi:MAG TPA: glucosaminidase domain-containing protein [Ktedonosporobacter sp.]|nr:glucosaminidase domain-containing protein [Ktedonosporobacter sp.]